MIKMNLDRLETRLRSLFEESLVRIFTGKSTGDDFINEFIRVMQVNLIQTPEGITFAPDRFILEVSPEDLEDWQVHQVFLNAMTDRLSEWGIQEGFEFKARPTIEIRDSQTLARHDWQIKVNTTLPDNTLPDTAAMENRELLPEEELIPENAFLVVGGKTNFPLQSVVVDIGRHSDNDLVIEDQYISRHHAQLRAINRRYVIFDVGSTGGVLINGKLIKHATLHPGDVIQIGMTHLIFIQDTTGDTPTTAIPVDPESGEIV